MNTLKPLAYSNDVETIPLTEPADIQHILAAMKQLMARTREQTGELRRDFHVKSHGCAHADFRILPELPPELAQGLFSQAGVFPAIVRFSNSAPQPQSDAVPDGRGLSIQVRNVSGNFLPEDTRISRTQDFLMVNHPCFIVANVNDFLRLQKIRLESGGNPVVALRDALTGGDWNPFDWHWREAFAAAQVAGNFLSHPAGQTYYSMVPIRYGDYVAKYRAIPATDPANSTLKLLASLASESDAMRLALEETLRARDLRFEFQVQLRRSTETMPVEDASITWPESESPFQTVAHLTIPRQDITSPQLRVDCEKLAFNVWHALAAHRPLGGINRARREAYALSFASRTPELSLSTPEERDP